MTSAHRPPHPDPLTPEEREMAARLARLGPHDGPSAALDARILAAAHAATGPGAAPRRRGMRRVLALPAGWLTGAGLAASMALVLGVVWQLQPPGAVVAERGEAPVADGGFVPAQPVPSGRPRVLAPAAPPVESTEMAPAAQRIAEPQVRKRAAPQRDVADARADRSTDAVSEMPAAVADSAAPPAPPPPAAAVAATPAAAAESAATSQESGQDALTRAPARRHSYTNSARAASAAMAESRALRQSAARDPGRESAAMAPAAAAPSADGLTPDHPPSEWFAEVRRLRDGGELEAARALLERFVEAHPSHALPDDLRPLHSAPPPVP